MKRYKPEIKYDEYGEPWVEMVESADGAWVSSEVAFPKAGYLWTYRKGWTKPEDMIDGEWYWKDGVKGIWRA